MYMQRRLIKEDERSFGDFILRIFILDSQSHYHTRELGPLDRGSISHSSGENQDTYTYIIEGARTRHSRINRDILSPSWSYL
jgi:hypothetical protein